MTTTTDEFARIVAHTYGPNADRFEWRAAWTGHLATVGPWRYRHPGGGYATFRPTLLTADLLAELVRRADADGLAPITFADLALALSVQDPAALGSHIRALRHLGAIERFMRPGACNLYRLCLERLPGVPVVA
jgi:hypothetical protein